MLMLCSGSSTLTERLHWSVDYLGDPYLIRYPLELMSDCTSIKMAPVCYSFQSNVVCTSVDISPAVVFRSMFVF